MAKLLTYSIEKNIPVVRRSGHAFDKTSPEYVTMTKLKVGESFEFPSEKINKIHNVRVYLQKEGSPVSFSFTSRNTFNKNPKLKVGRCWRIK